MSAVGWLFLQTQSRELSVEIERLLFLSVIIVLTGFLDDLAAQQNIKGFRGHFKQLFKGELTTGTIKAFTVLVVTLLVLTGRDRQLPELFIDTGLILLMTNFINLLDLRPGRAAKIVIVLILLLFFLQPFLFVLFIPPVFALIFYLWFELNEKVMLGDSGANFLGVITGYGFTFWTSIQGKIMLLLVLLFLNLISERVSFSSVIEKNCFLKWLDELGR